MKKGIIYNIYNEEYILYWKECKKNICMECEEMHNNHKKYHMVK